MELINKMSKTIDDFRLFFVSNEREESIDIGEIAKEAANAFEEQLSSLNIRIRIDGDGFVVIGQKELLRDVISSLILNAKDAISERLAENPNFKGDITIKLDPQNKRFECVDNGGGMSEEDLARAFEPYFTTKHASAGTGLGLYMSKMIINNSMKGFIVAKNCNDGVCFTITIPQLKSV